MAFRAARDLEDPRYAGLGLVEHWSRGAGCLRFSTGSATGAVTQRGPRWFGQPVPIRSSPICCPILWYFLLGTVGLTYFDTHFAFGWTGVIKSVVFTLLMLAFASMLTRARIRLQL